MMFSIFLSFCFIFSSEKNVGKKGFLIVGAGLPGSGKSSTIRVLARLFKTQNFFLEPEEKYWPVFFKTPRLNAGADILMWLRSIRVPMLWTAQRCKENGEIALVDSYYDKMLYSYIGNKDHYWLIKPENQYFPALKEIAKIDQSILPNADYIIFFKIDSLLWRKFIISRGRKTDANLNLLKNFDAQESIWKSCLDLSKRYKSKIVVYHHQFNHSPQVVAEKIFYAIKKDLKKESERSIKKTNRDRGDLVIYAG